MRRTRLKFLTCSLAIAAVVAVDAAAVAEEPSNDSFSVDEVIDALSDAAPFVLEPPTATFTGDDFAAPGFSVQPDGRTVAIESAADTVVGATPAEGFTVGGRAVTPLGVADDAEISQYEGTALIQSGTGSDAATVLRPTSTGVETFQVLGGPEAPRTFTWQIDLASDERLVTLANGGVAAVSGDPVDTTAAMDDDSSISLPDDADTVEDLALDPAASAAALAGAVAVAEDQTGAAVSFYVSPPVAWDADGDDVPAVLSVVGDTVTMSVAPGDDITYPVVADPLWWSGATEYTGFGAVYPIDKVKADISTMKQHGLDLVVLSPQLMQTAGNHTNSNWGAIKTGSDIHYPNGNAGCGITNDGGFDNTYIERIVAAGKYAKDRDMGVVVKPLVDPAYWQGSYYKFPDGGSRTKMYGADADAWWDSYTCKMLQYSDIASAIQGYNAPGDQPPVKFLVGTELTLMTDNAYDDDRMTQLINKVQARHGGLVLGYAANYDATIPPKPVGLDGYFYRKLDFIGVDAYYTGPGAEVADSGATMSSIVSAWGTKLPAGADYTCSDADTRTQHLNAPAIALQCLRDRWGKPVVISELGYTGANKAIGIGAAYNFWAAFVDARPGTRCGWFKGIWLWAETTSSDPFDLNDPVFNQADAKADGQLVTADC